MSKTSIDTDALTAERRGTHGDWALQAAVTDALQDVMRASTNYAALPAGRRQALDMIAVKIGRILEGDPAHADHWNDIGGYALLGRSGHGS